MSQSFKGIALFTPGGDLLYCLDPNKRERWHLHLCLGLQKIFRLPEPPHFLIPGYTATVDHWIEPHSQQGRTIAEVYPAVKRYQCLLNAIFGVNDCRWQVAPWNDEQYNPLTIERYRSQFPQLWKSHDLIVRWDRSQNTNKLHARLTQSSSAYLTSGETGHVRHAYQENAKNPPPAVVLIDSTQPTTQPYVLRLFVSRQNLLTIEQTLTNVHRILEQGLKQPYTLKVIDIAKHPELAEKNHVSATPTLVRVWPQPIRRIVGQLEDWERILQILAHV